MISNDSIIGSIEEKENLTGSLNNSGVLIQTYTLPVASANTLGGIKVGANLTIDKDGTLNANASSNEGGNGNVSSDVINSIVVVDELPTVEEEGVLYLIKEIIIDEDTGEDTPIVEYITNPTMEIGKISSSTGELEDNPDYCRTADYVYIKGKPTLTITNDIDASMNVVCYDENKNFMENWFIDEDGSPYSYKRISSGGTFTFPDDVYYIKFRFSSSEIVNVTIIYE